MPIKSARIRWGDGTINTVAMGLDGSHYRELYDYWGGLPDLREKVVRVLHSLSFVDDPTRMLRAARFEQRFHFKIGQRTLELLAQATSLLGRVTGERIRHELDHILVEPNRTSILSRLNGLGLLTAIHSSLKWDPWLEARLDRLPTENPDNVWEIGQDYNHARLIGELAYIIWLLRLSSQQVRLISDRLKLPIYLMKATLEAGRLSGS